MEGQPRRREAREAVLGPPLAPAVARLLPLSPTLASARTTEGVLRANRLGTWRTNAPSASGPGPTEASTEINNNDAFDDTEDVDSDKDGSPAVAPSMIFKGRWGNAHADFLLDSGAETCVVSLAKLQKLGMTHKIVRNTDGRKLFTADGTESQIRGTVTLSYTIGEFRERRKFTVVDTCAHEFILGMPFFMDMSPNINYRDRTMKIGMYNTRKSQPEYYVLKAMDTECVPCADTGIKFMRLGEARRLCRKNKAAILLVFVRPSSRAGTDLTNDEEGQYDPKLSSAASGLQQRTGGKSPGRVQVASMAASPAESAR